MRSPLDHLSALSGAAAASALPTDDVSVLNRLIACAERAMQRRPNFEEHVIDALAADVAAAARRPSEQPARAVDDHSIAFAALVVLADRALHRHDRELTTYYICAIGTMLPHVQNDLIRALEQRANTRPTP
ncbi:hypothetical protein IP86_03090 [Rhodopseudomonas sp. AAP120]|uniref:hypothetical protein n=1 Tax=Rhodopseudomonas sp. AAP120 TaxID=1523430 RepID=UPI0006B890E0|nr:hypothetical protein [Rhodopseudomonas sp. AAP120]KPG01808.1 hypothetical protein IP86_03090 [Rhodopseudomonas sp. AAP120]